MKKFLGKIEMLNENNRPHTFGEFHIKLKEINEENVELDDTEDKAPLFSEADINQIKKEIYNMLKGRNDTGIFYNVKKYWFEPPTGLPTMVYVESNNIADYQLEIDELDNDPIASDEGATKEKVSDWDIRLVAVDKRPVSDEEFDKEMDYLANLPEPVTYAKSEVELSKKSAGREELEKRTKEKEFIPKPPYLMWFEIEVEPTKVEKRKDRLAAKEEEDASTAEEEAKLAAKRRREEEMESERSEKEAEAAAIAAAKGKKRGEEYDPEFGF